MNVNYIMVIQRGGQSKMSGQEIMKQNKNKKNSGKRRAERLDDEQSLFFLGPS